MFWLADIFVASFVMASLTLVVARGIALRLVGEALLEAMRQWREVVFCARQRRQRVEAERERKRQRLQ